MKRRQTQHHITSIIYDKKGRILSIGKNSFVKTHPMQAKHAAAVGLPEKPYIHSEIDAILKLKHTDKPYRIFISRIMKDGSYGLAKPCPICEEAIRKETTIKKIEWTV